MTSHAEYYGKARIMIEERWRRLCEAAAKDQDSDRLLELVRQINQMLDEKERRLKSQPQGPHSE